MIDDIQNIIVSSELSLHQLFKRMNDGRSGILLLVDKQGRLLQTLTDGDLRRLLLAGTNLDDTKLEFPDKSPITALEGSSDDELLEKMRANEVEQIPLLDAMGRPIDLIHIRDIETPILLSTPHMGEYEFKYVNQAFDTNWIAPLGPNVDAFENELAEKVGIDYAAALSSGTAAIHLALIMLGVKRDDIVFCSSLTFIASANPILYQGAKPVFIDSEPGSWNLSVKALERALSQADIEGKLPKALIVVNLYGQSADMEPILSLCEQYGVPIIEDAAESLGATYKGRSSGTLGHFGIYSFNGNKIITTSGGGMLVSNNGEMIEKARFLATQARDPAIWYQHSQIGFNYRMSNVLAGIGRGQLKVLDDRVEQRRKIFERYKQSPLSSYIDWMPEAKYGTSTRWLSSGILKSDITLTPMEIIKHLSKHQIEARPVWKPLHLQPIFSSCDYFRHKQNISVSDRLFSGGICLPSGSNMNEQHQERVIEKMLDILEKKQK